MLEDLQRVLDSSLRNASAFTRSLFEAGMWDAARVADFVNEERNITIATVTTTGGPHAVVVLGACVDGQIHFTVTPGSLLARNLDASPRVAFTVCDRIYTVMGSGTAVFVSRSLDDPELASFTPAGWDGSIYRIDLQRIFAG